MATGLCQQVARSATMSSNIISTIKQVTVIGSGLAGSGIAQAAAQMKYDVVLVDVSRDVLKTALTKIKSSLQKLAQKQFGGSAVDEEKYIEDTLSRLILTPMDPEWTVFNADLVIDATEGNLEQRQKLFAAIDKAAPKHTIFVTNTSSYSMRDVVTSTLRKDRFAGLHIFPPVPIMKLMEVIRIPETSDETFDKLMDFSRSIGKTPIACKDTPGYIVDRLLVPYMVEAMKMIARGDATEDDINTAMKLGAGHKMGPTELSKFLSLSFAQCVSILEEWQQRDPYYNSSEVRKED